MSQRIKKIVSFVTVLLAAMMLCGVGALAAVSAEQAAAGVSAGLAYPRFSSIEPVSAGLRISWTKADSADGYRLYRYDEHRGWFTLTDTGETSYLDTTVVSDNTYQYRVVGISAKGSILTATDTISIDYVAPPQITRAENTADGIRIRWTMPEGVSRIVLYRKNSGQWTRLTETADSAYLDTDVAATGSYTYTVRALAADGTFLYDFYDEVGYSVKRLSTPSLSVTCAAGGVSIRWNAVAGADGYRVFYKAGGTWKALTDTTGTSVIDTDVVSGNTYTYTVRCLSADGKSYTSYFDTAGKATRYIAAPGLTNAESTNGGIRLTWTKSNGASSYRVFYQNSKGGWTRLGDTASNTYTDTNVTSGNTYTYTVRCISDDGSGYISSFDPEGISCRYLSAPVISGVSSDTNGVKITWSPMAGAELYRIYYYGSKGWTKLADTTDTVFADTEVISGNTYTYTVRCLSADGTRFTSGFLSGKSVRYIAAPAIASLTNTETGVRITWGAVRGAALYRVYYYGGKGWTRMTDTTATSYVDTDVSSGNTYTYTVRCLSEDGGSFTSAFLPGKQQRYIAAPAISGLACDTDGVTVSWGAVKGAALYRVYTKTANGWSKLADTAATSYADKTVSSGETYTYTVRCLTADGTAFTSDFRAGSSIRYIAAPQITGIANTTTGVSIRWNAVTGAEKYRLYYQNGSGWTKLIDTTAASYTDTAAVSGNTYTYTVRCITADGKRFASSYDRTGATIRYIASPKNLKAESAGDSVKISWTASAGAEKYRVYYYGSKGWTKFAETADTSVIDKDVSSGYTYRYTVRCVDAAGNFTSSYDSAGVSYQYTAVPRLNAAALTKDGIQISWSPSAGAALYRVYYYGSKGWTKFAETADTSVIDTDVSSGYTYRYTVRCVTADGKRFTSDFDRDGVSRYYVAAPKLLNVETTSKRVTITWSKPAGSVKYRVYKMVSGTWTRLTDTTDNSYTDHTVSIGNTYVYTVRCISADGSTFHSSYDPTGFIVTVVSGGDFCYYDQTQYDYPYGDDTIAGSGCGPTSFAMIATTLTGKIITPVDAVAWCGNDYYIYHVGTMWNYFGDASARFGVGYEGQTYSIDDAIEALKKGKYVISSQSRGRFTSGGHFIVLAGLDADGRIIVYDPNGGNHYVGVSFTRDEINEAGTSYWIFDEL